MSYFGDNYFPTWKNYCRGFFGIGRRQKQDAMSCFLPMEGLFRRESDAFAREERC
jgi:hypothetical protein